MGTYVVTYDLRAPGRNYAALHEAIKALGAWWHHLESTWIVTSQLTAVQIRDRLRSHLDGNDKLLVAEMGHWWATVGIDAAGNDWLKQSA
jgi:hypothetical protein